MMAESAPSTSESKRVVVATAGHVDHGKTSLVRALTGTDTDRLPEEQRRGISIELGFAELDGAGLSFIDVPGHERLVHTMIAGVGGADALLLVVAADDGVMPQTREHLAVASVLGLRRAIVALSKADLVDAETLQLAEADVREAVAPFDVQVIGVVPTSTATGQGLAELERLLRALPSEVPDRPASARVWLSVDRVFSLRGTGTVVTGTLTRGHLREGDPIFIAREAGSIETACRSLEVHGRRVAHVSAPARVAINLARLPTETVHRGDVVTKDAELPSSRRLDISMHWLPGAAPALGAPIHAVVHLGTLRAEARVLRWTDDTAHVVLERPVPCEGGIGVVVRGVAARRNFGRVLGGGRVLDAMAPLAPRRRDVRARELRAGALGALAAGDVATGLLDLLRYRAPRPVVAPDLERRLGLEPGSVDAVFGDPRLRSQVVRLGEPHTFATPDGIAALVHGAVDWVKRFHVESPNELGAPIETLRGALSRGAGRPAAEYAIARALESSRMRAVDAGRVCLPEFGAQAMKGHDEAVARARAVLAAAALEGASEGEIAERSRLPLDRTRAALGELAKTEHARRLAGLWFGGQELANLRAAVRAHLEAHATMSVPAFKQLFGISRKQAIPLLEELDHQGVTRRQGDERVLGPAKEK